MKTKFTLTTPFLTFTGTAEQFLAHSHEFPTGVLDAMLTLQLGRVTTFENLGAGDDTFVLELVEDHRMSDFMSAFTYINDVDKHKIANILWHAIAIAHSNHAHVANHMALLNTFTHSLVSR
jgi:hypothetical protein